MDDKISRQLEKQKAVKKEMARLTKIFRNIPPNIYSAAESLIEEASYMRATMAELKAIIDITGPVEQFEQGSNKFLREHPAVKTYNTMIQRYATICKQLFDLLPNVDKDKKNEDELLAFVKKARK